MSKVEETDSALARYYAKFNVDYYDDNGVGKFQSWCDENGYDDGMIADEFDENPEDCTIIDFDAEFPLQNEPEDKAEKIQQIFKIIKECFDDKDAFSGNLKIIFPPISADFFDIEGIDIDEVREIYSNTCAAIMDLNMLNDRNTIKFIAIGMKHKIEYFQHFADCYSRDRIVYEIAHKEKDKNRIHPLTEATWSGKGNSKLFDTIRNVAGDHHAISTLSAVSAFFCRICPKLIMSETTKIEDNIDKTAQYITSAVIWISKLAQGTQESTCPFMVDLSIAYKKAIIDEKFVDVGNRMNRMNKIDANDDETEFKETGKEFFDCIGDIEAKLKKNNLHFKTVTIDEWNENEKWGIGSSGRVFQKVFDEFKIGIKQKNNNYPQKRRLNIFIDRRKGHKASDRMTMFEPPDNCKFIPNQCISLWCLSASRSCLIPNMEYDADILDAINAMSYKIIHEIRSNNEEKKKKTESYSVSLCKIIKKKQVKNGMDFELMVKVDHRYWKISIHRENEPIKYILSSPVKRDKKFTDKDETYDITKQSSVETKQKLVTQNIKSNDHCKGGILTISFHILEKDKIKMYLFINGQMTRFMPEDIQYILPKFFSMKYDSAKNSEWSQGKEVQKLLQKMNGRIHDLEFEAFYKKYRSDIKYVKSTAPVVY